jgi:hypothetical protein
MPFSSNESTLTVSLTYQMNEQERLFVPGIYFTPPTSDHPRKRARTIEAIIR